MHGTNEFESQGNGTYRKLEFEGKWAELAEG